MSKKVIISVGRQLGSGGREIARMLASKFDCEFYDREILNLAARESGFSEKIFEQHDERKGFFRHLQHRALQDLDCFPYMPRNIKYFTSPITVRCAG